MDKEDYVNVTFRMTKQNRVKLRALAKEGHRSMNQHINLVISNLPKPKKKEPE